MATRRERVLLELEDQFTGPLARAAVATKAFEKTLNSLDGTNVSTNRTLAATSTEVEKVGKSTERTGAQIDKLSGRLAIFGRVAAAVGPGLVPIGGVGIAAVTGLSAQFGFATAGALSLVVAAQGVGDAMEAIQKADLEPTAANIQAAQEAMTKLAPEAQAFVARFQELRPVLGDIRDSAAAGWFPGLTDALDALDSAAPRIESLMRTLGEAGGGILGNAAESLAGPEWAEFIAFIEAEAPRSMEQLASSVGNVARGLAEMWMAFQPLNASFGDWLVDTTRDFSEWAQRLGESSGFQEFVDYIRDTGPQVAAFMGAITDAVVGLVTAAAPLGGPVLHALTAFAEAFAAIASSPIGTPLAALVTAMSALRLSTAAMTGISTWAGNLTNVGAAAGGASTNLASFARSAGLAAAAYAAFDFGGDIVDSFNRSRDALDSSADSVEALTQKLESSNVGKFAEDLGIDVQRLAQDLVTSGESGEYYQAVLEQMGAASEGAGGKINALSDFLGPWIGDTEQASLAQLDLGSIMQDNSRIIGEYARECRQR